METGTEKIKKEQAWMKKCKTRADELQSISDIDLPHISYTDRMTLDLGNITMHLIWFGNTGNYKGLTMAMIPGAKS